MSDQTSVNRQRRSSLRTPSHITSQVKGVNKLIRRACTGRGGAYFVRAMGMQRGGGGDLAGHFGWHACDGDGDGDGDAGDAGMGDEVVG